jgi:hypothetical protein
VATQLMTRWQIWMVKVIAGVVNHSDSVHDPPRTNVVSCCKRHNFVELQDREAECQGSLCTFGRIAVPPELRSDTPPDFRTRRESRFEPGNRKTDEANEWRNVWNFDGPEAPAALFDLALNAFGKSVALFSGKHRRKILHHAVIRIEASERVAIAYNPSSQAKAGRAEF